jgi:hypothetical protein
MATDSAGMLPYLPAPAGPEVLPGQTGNAFRARKHERDMADTEG